MKMLNKLLRRPASDLIDGAGDFSRSDRRAIVEEFAPADAIEAGLGEALARFIITGENESVLLRLDAILAGGDETTERLKLVLFVQRYWWNNGSLSTDDELKTLVAGRRRLLVDLEGFDAAGMRRLGILHAKADKWHWGYGTDRSPAWLRSLAKACEGARDANRDEKRPALLTAPRIRAMLACEGGTAATIVDLFFGYRFAWPSDERTVGLIEVLAAEPDAVCDEMLALSIDHRGLFINFLADHGLLDRVPAFFERIFAAAGANARATREPALGALAKGDPARVEARGIKALASADVEERLAGVYALAAVLGAGAMPILEAHAASERSKRVLGAIEALRPRLAMAEAAGAAARDDGPEGYVAIDGALVVAPPLQETPDTIPADTADELRRLMAEAAKASRMEWDALPTDKPYSPKKQHKYQTPHDLRTVTPLVAIMKGATGGEDRSTVAGVSYWSAYYLPKSGAAYGAGLRALFTRAEMGTPALARLFAAIHRWDHTVMLLMRGIATGGPVFLAELSRRLRAGADFRMVRTALEASGAGAAGALPAMLAEARWYGDPAPAANPTVWPVVAEYFAAIDVIIAAKAALRRSDAHALVIGLCEMFPAPPRRWLPTLLDAAAQGARTDRRRARLLLAGAGDLTPVIAPLLKDGAVTVRAGAAQWMAERRDALAIPVLRDALGHEKTIVARAAILSGLAACGDDIADQFAEDRLAAEATRELPRLKVDFSAFVERADLPRLRWADGRAVEATIVEYWYARAHKLKQPGGDPLLSMVLARLDRADAAAMGRSILASFVAIDTRKATVDEANARAEAEADARFKSYGQWRKDYTREQAFAEIRQECLSAYLGSALDHRGLLALARFAPPGEAVAIVERYLKDHGKRANQCRALLDMLAGDPIPQKLQLLLATARRHKQPGARKHAGDLADAIAAERGWSAAELADRTVPTLDLDADGTRPLPIGERVFRLRLVDQPDGLSLAIENPDGKTVAAMPTSKDTAGAADAKAAKAVVANARKELKQTVALQAGRLFESMCTGRSWDADDFAATFLAHPILGRLLRRLALTALDEKGAIVTAMRPLDDGTLSDVDDAPVALDDAAATGIRRIGIAHRATLGETAAKAWQAHFEDYDVQPLFSQFDRAPLPLPEAKGGGVPEIDDRRGHAIDALALRNAAAKRGYAPGAVMDGGSYDAFERPFADLGLAASIGFSGGIVGDRGTHLAALHALRFVRLRDGKSAGWDAEAMPFAEVPPILLQEAWADYHAIAAAGSGFDPNWEKLGPW